MLRSVGVNNTGDIANVKTYMLPVVHAAKGFIGVEAANTLATVGGGSRRSLSSKSVSVQVDCSGDGPDPIGTIDAGADEPQVSVVAG